MKEKFDFFEYARSCLNFHIINDKKNFELDFKMKVEDIEFVNYKYGKVLHDNFREDENYFVELLLGTDGNLGSLAKYLVLIDENFEFIEDAFV